MGGQTSPKVCPMHRVDDISEVDMLDAQMRARPWPFYDWLRADPKRRVYKLPQEDNFYVLHRYEDVRLAFLDAKQFSSKIIPTKDSLFFALMDGDAHRSVRQVLQPIFLSTRLDTLWDTHRVVIEKAVDKFCEQLDADILDDLAIPLPLTILCQIFGLPNNQEDVMRLYEQSLAINKAFFVVGGTGPRRPLNPTFDEKFRIVLSQLCNSIQVLKLLKHLGRSGIQQLWRKIRVDGRKNITKFTMPRPNYAEMPAGILAFEQLCNQIAEHLEANQSPAIQHINDAILLRKISKLDGILAVAFVLFAGHETTVSLISNAVSHLTIHPEIFERLKRRPDLISNFIEEILRIYTPVTRFLRRTTTDVRIEDFTIPKGAVVILMPGAANVDRAFDEQGCTFNFDRKPMRHLSFGQGQHYCLGSNLARRITEETLRHIISKIEYISFQHNEPHRFVTDRDNGLYRMEHCRVKLHKK